MTILGKALAANKQDMVCIRYQKTGSDKDVAFLEFYVHLLFYSILYLAQSSNIYKYCNKARASPLLGPHPAGASAVQPIRLGQANHSLP